MASKSNQMLSSIFHERGQFMIIGLTGRTGSGCTTAANILESTSPDFPLLANFEYRGEPFYQGLDARRYEILSKYASEKFQSFISIKVSDLISSYLLLLNPDEMIEFAFNQDTRINKTHLQNTIIHGKFSKNYIVQKFSNILRELLIHKEKPKLEPEELENFMRFLKLIRKFTRDFKKELQEVDNHLYVKVYQAAGNSIRRVGAVEPNYTSMEFVPIAVLQLPETINRTIKIIRKTHGKAFIVIDAIRNPFEAKFFRERYAAFYLISVNAPDEDRKSYLQNVHKFSVDEFDQLEKRESGKTVVEDADFISQNVQRCIEISDIHIFNPRNELENNNVLKAQLAWYFSLMLHPGLATPSALERVMQIAYTAKSNSGCISRQVGAVVTDKNNSIKAVGWNDVAKGQVPCNLRSLPGLLNHFDAVTYSEYERNNTEFRNAARKELIKIVDKNGAQGKNLSYCFKDLKNSIDRKSNQVHTRSLHAEENAFLQLAKYGSSAIEGGKLFTTASPCELCAKKAYQLGISEIVYIDPYPGIAKDHIIAIGENPPKLIQFRGAVGRGYYQLYEPTLPYKDELNYLKDNDD
ncbi:anti-phage dCTP deaminase [Pseudomonas mangrovi]|uniref:Deoxycytidylate deaminase n=1 Tax=Pseudomonas mangrovi TaxID=2161748 RepID=A0A2T5PE50_9PSED|nr:anti-phage dCTP deaminase [Pseudomonas mangrovi]PTU76015.1 deoxycytidylate deaminase [Pseudomonas mangrovi]